MKKIYINDNKITYINKNKELENIRFFNIKISSIISEFFLKIKLKHEKECGIIKVIKKLLIVLKENLRQKN